MSKQRILVVDDSPTVVNMLSLLLEEQGYEVVSASDGLEAIETFYQQRPDLVVLDVVMPKMNGYQVCRLLKDDPQVRETPIIILTNEDQPKDKFWGLQVGADDYLVKGVDFSLILETIQQRLNHSHSVQRRPSAPSLISGSDILSKVNSLLDRKLFQVTVLNEIAQIASSMREYLGTLDSLFALLAKIFDYQVGAILLADQGEEESLVLKVDHPVSEGFIDDVKDQLLKVLSGQKDFRLKRENLSVKILPLGQELISKGEGKAESFATCLLRSRGQMIGALGLASAAPLAFTDQNKELLQEMAAQMAVLLDNARLYKTIEELAITDSLTKSYNRGFFQDQLEREFKRAERYNLTFSVMMADIDGFKRFNDTNGHLAGDLLLQEVASLMKNALRASDILARYGGDEFVIMLSETAQPKASEVAERLREMMEKYYLPEPAATRDRTFKPTISFGLVQYPHPEAVTAWDLVKLADEALYRAKEAGGNQVCCAVRRGGKRNG